MTTLSYDTWKYLYKVIVLANKSLDIISSQAPDAALCRTEGANTTQR